MLLSLSSLCVAVRALNILTDVHVEEGGGGGAKSD